MNDMEFRRVGEHTIRCLISEEEIHDLGFSVEDIITNGARTQEFMNHIFDMAEEEFETKFDMGIKTVQVEFHADRTMALTFSEHPIAGGMMEHLKDIVNGLINSIPQQKLEEIAKEKARQISADTEKKVQEQETHTDILVMVRFADLDTLIRFAGKVCLEQMPPNGLYKEKDAFYLMMDLSVCTEDQVRRLSSLTDEYATDIQVGAERWAHLLEHGQCEQLRELA